LKKRILPEGREAMEKVVEGGRNLYGQAIGIIMLETVFPRIPGEMGNATTWDFPVEYRIVKGASPQRVVREADSRLLEPFVEVAKDLERMGVRAITTNCGFLIIFQKEIADAVDIPVFTSSLMQVPLVYQMLKSDQKVGIIAVDSRSLTQKHLMAARADSIPTVIVGTEDEEEFTNVMIGNIPRLDIEKARAELVKTAKKLISEHPEVGAIVLECTNMPPYARAIQKEVNLPVFDMITLTNMVYEVVVRKEYVGFM